MVSGAAGRLALLFPGQGSQSVGMGRAICEASPEAREVFARADRALGVSLSRVCFEGPADELRRTATTQPAILTTSLALHAAMTARLPGGFADRVVCAAGHSLGEYSALVAAGALDLEDAVRAVHRRGQYMQEAVPEGEGAMAAVLGASLDTVEGLCREAAGGDVLTPANLNGPEQTVVAGHAAAVARLSALARSRGVRRVIPLEVSAPFHCPLMAPARARLALDLAALPLRDARFPVITNVGARAESTAAAFRPALEAQVTAPVRWVETIRAAQEMGAMTLVEVGPGRVLTGLARKIVPDLITLNVEDPASLEHAVAALRDAAAGRGAP